MKKFFTRLRDTLISGILFLLPLLILFVLLSKVFQFLSGLTGRMAAFFGLNSVLGSSGNTIIAGIAILLFCLFCGELVRISFFSAFSKWLDKKLAKHVPGYSVYREMAVSKIDEKDE